MRSIDLSVVIPSYKDPLLIKTIDSILENFEAEFEIIAVLDGYWPSFQLREHPRVRYVHLGHNRGMRGAINAGVAVSRGKYLMRFDEHCMVAKGFDRIMIEGCQENWICTAKRYFLDPIKWEVMDISPVECEKLVIQDCGENVYKFSGKRWDSRAKELKDSPIIESMAMQGSFWCMPHSWWDKVIGDLQVDGYGPFYQDSHEMVFKAWKAGGRLMFNNNTWYAHKHRDFPRTHNYGKSDAAPGWAYSLEVWRDYYEKEIAPKWKI